MGVTKEFLSASTNGRPTKIVATATAGTLLHTAPAGTTSKDEIWVFVTNTDVVDRNVTIEFGGTTAPDDHIRSIVPAGETIPVLIGQCINNGLLVRAFGAAANVLVASGFVNRIS